MTPVSAASRGRHTAPLSFDAELQEHLAKVVGHHRETPGRHVACAGQAFTAGVVEHCTLAPGHAAHGTDHVYAPGKWAER